jgi:uncharacterized membrane protein
MLELFASVIMPSLLTSIGWGIAPILDRKALPYVENNSQKAFIIKILSASFFSVIVYLFSNTEIDFKNEDTQKGIMYLAGSAFFSTIVAYYFYYIALKNSNNTTLVIFITYITPLIIVSILSALFLKEEMTLGMIASMIVCLIGISMFIYFSNEVNTKS